MSCSALNYSSRTTKGGVKDPDLSFHKIEVSDREERMILARLCLEELRREELRRARCRRRRLLLRMEYEVLADNRDFQTLYRLTPQLFEELCSEIAPLLPEPRRSDNISPAKKIMTALAFFASGSSQWLVASNVGVGKKTVSLAVQQVTAALNQQHILFKYIRFPQNQRERAEIKLGFYRNFGVPGVVGCIDCTHVALVTPREYEERYFNSKYYHSRNVQLICDSNYRIISVDGSYGGASYDSYVFLQSQVKRHLEQLQETTWLLGDALYPLREYLMTPINNAAENTPEAQYNEVHKSAMTTMERTLQILKGRWRCLLAARELRYDPLTAAKIINACCVLHNFCIAQPTLAAPRLSERDLRVERYFQERKNIVVVLRRTAAAELAAGQEVQADLVQGLVTISEFPPESDGVSRTL